MLPRHTPANEAFHVEGHARCSCGLKHNVAVRAEDRGALASQSSEVLLQLGSGERREGFFLGWGMQDAARSKVFGL